MLRVISDFLKLSSKLKFNLHIDFFEHVSFLPENSYKNTDLTIAIRESPRPEVPMTTSTDSKI